MLETRAEAAFVAFCLNLTMMQNRLRRNFASLSKNLVGK